LPQVHCTSLHHHNLKRAAANDNAFSARRAKRFGEATISLSYSLASVLASSSIEEICHAFTPSLPPPAPRR